MVKILERIILIIAFSIIFKSWKRVRSEIVGANCTSIFCEDFAWPDAETVKPLPFYGSAIELDKRNPNHVVVLHRGTSMKPKGLASASANVQNSGSNLMIEEDILMVLDASSGKILKTWGGGQKFSRPHGIEISEDGSLFITDVLLHQVFKFNYNPTSGVWQEAPVLTLGEKFIPGRDHFHFCGPADVALLPSTRDFFVADGYCNSRVVKFDEFGAYLMEFQAGSANPLSPPVAFNITHAIRVALSPCPPDSSISSSSSRRNISKSLSTAHDELHPPIIFVADRNNGRIQIFTENGTFLYEIGHENFSPSRAMLFSFDFVSGACTQNPTSAYYGTLYAVNGHLPRGEPQVFEIAVGQSNYKVLSSFPLSSESESGVGMAQESELESPHDICASRNAEFLYVVEAANSLRLKKFVRSRESCDAVNSSGSSSDRKIRPTKLMNILFLSVFPFFADVDVLSLLLGTREAFCELVELIHIFTIVVWNNVFKRSKLFSSRNNQFDSVRLELDGLSGSKNADIS